MILGNLTNNGDTGVEGLTFSQAADEEIAYLLNDVPRAPNGAISHRESEVSCLFLPFSPWSRKLSSLLPRKLRMQCNAV